MLNRIKIDFKIAELTNLKSYFLIVLLYSLSRIGVPMSNLREEDLQSELNSALND